MRALIAGLLYQIADLLAPVAIYDFCPLCATERDWDATKKKLIHLDTGTDKCPVNPRAKINRKTRAEEKGVLN